ncbi:Uu.00g055270.m01.CDS01 [Anthostomella pinea]|uniref:Uu.00g055270.m01.CDS01 n=1 Tax=Anthostomella pinea TaxID=933095 RepID=A0AAI8YMB2_9PEZI|nr:Uu.00g055270.m01.CDS01 [Anthostomella pinea]
MLTRSTYTYATHEIPLECDVYRADDHYPDTTESPSSCSSTRAASLEAPGLVSRHGWPNYRLLPQVGAKGLLEDALAAYNFAQIWGACISGRKRPVIVGGASAGFFMANLIAHHVTPEPVAMLSLTGVPTFRHEFFNSSVLLTPAPIRDEDVASFVNGPLKAGTTNAYDPSAFVVDRLLPSGERNPGFAQPAPPVGIGVNPNAVTRESLYDYWLHRNEYLKLVGDVDQGFQWAKDDPKGEKLKSGRRLSSSKKAMLCLAQGEGHLFEATSLFEDSSPGMDAVREAVRLLDGLLGA